MRNHCPHKGAPVCKGILGGTWLPCGPGEMVYGRDGEVLVCPWHGFEFDLLSGEEMFQEKPLKLLMYLCRGTQRRSRRHGLRIEMGSQALRRSVSVAIARGVLWLPFAASAHHAMDDATPATAWQVSRPVWGTRSSDSTIFCS